MTNSEVWLALIGLTLITIITRSLFLLFGNHIELPDSLQRALRYAPAAALVAIIVPEIVLVKGQTGLAAFSLLNPHLWGGVAAVVAFLSTRSMIWTIVVGMVAFTAARWWL